MRGKKRRTTKSHGKLSVTRYTVVLYDLAPHLSAMVFQEVLVINICSTIA